MDLVNIVKTVPPIENTWYAGTDKIPTFFSSASWTTHRLFLTVEQHAVRKSVKEWSMHTLLCHFLKVFLFVCYP